MSWEEPIKYKSPSDEYVEVRILEQGVRLSFWKHDTDQSARSATFPWDDWEKLVSIVEAMRPQE